MKPFEVRIIPTAPFNFDATFHKPDHFTSGDNFWQAGTRWQTWNQQGRCLGLKFQKAGSTEKPAIQLGIFSSSQFSNRQIDELVAEIKSRYNLDLNLDEFYRLFKKDKVIGPAIKRLWGMRPGHPSSLYEYLIIGVVLQNAAVRRSIAMFRALSEHYGSRVNFDGKRLWCFCEPGRLKKFLNKSCGLSKLVIEPSLLKR